MARLPTITLRISDSRRSKSEVMFGYRGEAAVPVHPKISAEAIASRRGVRGSFGGAARAEPTLSELPEKC